MSDQTQVGPLVDQQGVDKVAAHVDDAISKGANAVVGGLVSVDEGWAVVAPDGRMEYTDGFPRWRCAHGITSNCAGGVSTPSTPGLLASMVRH